ncbi:hypothetical protein HanHA300_Chr04g0140791 [Helianthus annuus]|nr:hypothetical protein HanHA300_Chr04g0140791 [Helianthus annuus]KAJ0597360.1 hypothetical protein HanHA89_Chr04g0153751 [Helianthus annuus]KAJ0758021.1 hypothetical protein HanLR1_Chr04g0145601 [Helianthus annuus]
MQNRMFKSEFAPDCTAGMIAYILYDKSHCTSSDTRQNFSTELDTRWEMICCNSPVF